MKIAQAAVIICFLFFAEQTLGKKKACPRGWKDFTHTGPKGDVTNCYKLTRTKPYGGPVAKLTWKEAHKKCKDRGAELASIPDETVNDFISKWLAKRARSTELLIGGVDTSSYNDTINFRWIDGSNTYYRNLPAWGFSNAANENCLAMRLVEEPSDKAKAGTWNDVPCNDLMDDTYKAASVCSKPI